jgi:ABC-type multidrug transport system fused ATPase/permease subunit
LFFFEQRQKVLSQFTTGGQMNIQRQVLRQAWAIFGPLKVLMGWVLVLILLGQGLALMGPYIQGTLIDNLNHPENINGAYIWAAVSVGFMLASHWLVSFPRELIENAKIDFNIDEAASDQTMLRMTSLSVGQHNMMHSGIKQSVITRGQHSLTSLVNMLVYEIIPTVSKANIMAIALCWMNLPIGLTVVVAMVVFISLTLWLNYTHRHDLKKLEKMWNHESRFRSEILQHISHVLINAQERKALAEADAKYAEVAGFARPLWRTFIVLAYVKAMPIIVAQGLIMFLGIYYVHNGQLSLGKVVILWSWSTIALNGLWTVGHLQRQIIRMWTSIKTYCEFLSMESDLSFPEHPVVLEPIRGRIEAKNLSFVYQNRMKISRDHDEVEEASGPAEEETKPSALHDVSFCIEPGETVALVGESGSGKTTLANLILRASDPSSGSIYIDGHDLCTLDLKSYRHQVGVVEQNVPLWDQSIRYNILYGLNGKAADVTTEELERISEIAQISRFAHKLEKGFDTLIGERGIKLSGGERQRVGIARALIKNPPILIFDEATSSLDAAVEADIREAIKEASRGRTTIIIAHRFSTIRYASRIIVMEEGRIAGQGKHEDLYRSCEPYRRLVDHQLTAGSELTTV